MIMKQLVAFFDACILWVEGRTAAESAEFYRARMAEARFGARRAR